ncbi:IPT/TIG domain-containing protein [Flavitalea sp.]|nr:IPT/TIG domain-containing protein [Flavitalea sp.]
MQKLISRVVVGVFLCSFSLLTSCKKDVKESKVSETLQVKPSEESDDQLEINGTGFGNELSSVKLSFNGKPATIKTVSDKKIIATIPTSDIKGPADLSINGITINLPVFSLWKTTVSTYAGTTVEGYADGNKDVAQFNGVEGIAVDTAGNLYIADANNNRIRKITIAGVVSTIAGTGVAGFADGIASVAMFSKPTGIAVDNNLNIYVGDKNNHRVRKITPAGIVSTLAGTGVAGLLNGSGSVAKFNTPCGLTLDASNNVYVADQVNNCIRKITPLGVVSMYAGTGNMGFQDGNALGSARFTYPSALVFDKLGNLFIADRLNNSIRKVSGGIVSTVAGNGWEGATDGTKPNVTFHFPSGITANSSNTLFVTDSDNDRIRRVSSIGVVSTYAGSLNGYQDGNASVALFEYPRSIAIDSKGILYVGEKTKIRKITRTSILIFQ